jgi:hypothetical protein
MSQNIKKQGVKLEDMLDNEEHLIRFIHSQYDYAKENLRKSS